MATIQLGPARLEILRSAFTATAEEMAVAVFRTSRSEGIRDMLDFSTAVFDARGKNVAQAARIPIHLNTMAPCLENILANYIPLEAWEDGDTVVTNDPYCGGQHLPDVMTFTPVMVDGQCIAFCGTICHHRDIGGPSPGSYNAAATEIFAEGMRIPPIKLKKKGQIQEDVLALILQNVRQSDMMRADLMGQVAALDIGKANMLRLVARYGESTVSAAIVELLRQSESAVRRAIEMLPDGSYSFEDYVDDDGIDDHPLLIAVKLIVKGSNITVDLTGTSPQAKGPINCTLNILKSAVYYGVITGLGGDFPISSGCYEPIDIIAPEGTVVNAREPAPVVSRITVGHRVVNVIIGALSKAIPGRIPASYYGCSYAYHLQSMNANGVLGIYGDSIVGGWGAEPRRDGATAFSCGLHNLASIPIEMIESRHPVVFTRHAIRGDSGGAGLYRGGLGMIREWRLEAEYGVFAASLDRFLHPALGLGGGRSGAPGRLLLTRNGAIKALKSKLVRFPLRKGDVITVETPGGGGYGLPEQRSKEDIERDIHLGLVSLLSAKEDYGYVPGLA